MLEKQYNTEKYPWGSLPLKLFWALKMKTQFRGN